MKFIIITVCLFGVSFATPTKPILGEWKIVPVDSPTAIKLAAKGVEHHNENDDSLNYEKLITIKQAKSQFDQGILYEVEFLIGKTDCAKSDANAASCEVPPNAIRELCTYIFMARPWVGLEKITQASCVPAE